MVALLLSKLKSTAGITFTNKVLSYVLILSMICASLLFNDKEIVLPEMAALAVGCFIYQNPVWISKPLYLFLLPSLTAVFGLLINKLDVPIEAKLILILLLMIVILRIFKSAMAPALATGLLPIITNSHSFYFILSILFFTMVLAISVALKNGVSNNKVEFGAENQTKNNILYLVLISSWILFCSHFGWIFMAAIPPIIVVGYESVHKKEYLFETFYKQLICLFLASFIGVQALHLINNLIVVAFVDILLVSILLRLLKFKLPPAYAMALLPIVLHTFLYDYFYWHVFIMSVFILGTVYIYKNLLFLKKYFLN